MKSIVEEASSIKQAIENGWKRLGEPTTFSVKILERPETGFFGFSTKSAKVALIVEDTLSPSRARHATKHEQAHKPTNLGAKNRYSASQPNQHVGQQASHYEGPSMQQNMLTEGREKEVESGEETAVKWSDQRVAFIQDWLKTLLKLMGKEAADFETVVTEGTLYITFKGPLFPTVKEERFVFASMSHLMMETLRNKYKKMARTMRIIISST